MAITAGKPIDAAYLLAQLKSFESKIISEKYNVKFQLATMPAASASTVGVYVQYIGATTPDYTSGFFYKGIEIQPDPEVGGDVTYAWEPVTQLVPEYTVKKLDAEHTTTGCAASYIFTKDDVQVGPTIDIPKDFFLTDAKFGTVTEADKAEGGKFVDRTDLKVGDTYLELDVNITDGTSTTIKPVYVNMTGLVDVYTAGIGISIDENKEVSVKTAAVSGLEFVGTDEDELAIKTDAAGPVSVTADGVNVNIGDGFVINSDNAIALDLDDSLSIDPGTKKLKVTFETTNIDFDTEWN